MSAATLAMPPIQIPQTAEDLFALAREHDAAYFFESQTDDPEERKRAGARITAIEKAFDDAACTIDEDGKFIVKESSESA